MSLLPLLLLVSTSTTAHFHYPVVPDARETPGLIDTTKTKEDLCGKVRVRHRVPSGTKRAVYITYGPIARAHHVELDPRTSVVDHLISPELGGANLSQNLWPEPFSVTATVAGERHPVHLGAHQKDLVENQLYYRVCGKGDLALADAQRILRDGWADYYLEMRKSGEAKKATHLSRR